MHKLPSVVFKSKNARSPESHWCESGAASHLGLDPVDSHNVRKLRGHVFFDELPASELAIVVQGCCTLQCRGNLLPPANKGSKRVAEGYIVAMRPHHLVWLRVAFYELSCRQVISLNGCVE